MNLMTATRQVTMKATLSLTWSCAFGGRRDQLIEAYPSFGTKPAHSRNPEEGT